MSAILLNGVSSAGKTSIVKAIQAQAGAPWVHVSLDGFIQMIGLDGVTDPTEVGRRVMEGVANLHRALPALLAGKYGVVIDHVFEREEWRDACLAVLAVLAEHESVLKVGVHCSLKELRKREISRGNRRLGQAEAQLPLVHRECVYDLEVDTSLQSPGECAELILAAFNAVLAKHNGD